MVVQRLTSFLHAPNRDAAGLDAFAREIYRFLHRLDFDIVSSRFSDEDVEKIDEGSRQKGGGAPAGRRVSDAGCGRNAAAAVTPWR
jgi:hypothetical protein